MDKIDFNRENDELKQNGTENRLTAMKGDIFKLDDKQFDAAVAFIKNGFNCFFGDFLGAEKSIEKSNIGYVIYLSSVGKNKSYIPYKAYLRDFSNEQEMKGYVKRKIFESLDFALKCGPRIAFHGLQIHGWDISTNEDFCIAVVQQWLSQHPEASVVMVDIRGSFGKYLNEFDQS